MQTNMNAAAAVTICSVNYLAKAHALADSYRQYHPQHDFFLVVVDRRIELPHIAGYINVIWVEELQIPDFEQKAFEFDVIELNTNVKPRALSRLLADYRKVVYLDPDICLYSNLDVVYAALDDASVVATPHSLTPIHDGCKPDDVDFLRFGVFNLGFIGVSQSPEAFAFLAWWSDRCLEFGFYEPQSGLAVDQKWVNLAPALCPHFKVLRAPGLNIAFWNLHERQLSLADGHWVVNGSEPVYFIHFSSFDPRIAGLVAGKQTRFPVGSRPDFDNISAGYREALLRYMAIFSDTVPYSFARFDDGTYVTAALRRVYSSLRQERFATARPFQSRGPVFVFAAKHGLLERSRRPASPPSFRDATKFGFEQRVVLRLLKLLLRVIGPTRYFLFMRYLAHMSSIRNQRSAFDR